MQTILMIGLLALGLGTGFAARELGVFGFQFISRENYPDGTAIVVLLLAVLLIAAPVTFVLWASRRWREYVSAAQQFAEDFVEDRRPLAQAPKRPGFVVAQDFDDSTPQSLQPESIDDILVDVLPERIRDLLQPSGEQTTLLGQSVLNTYTQRDELGSRLEPAWVVDRIWSDGRMTTEWAYAGRSGSRLRYSAGGAAFGRLPWRSTSAWNSVLNVVLMPSGLVFLGFMSSAYGSTCLLLGPAMIPIAVYSFKWLSRRSVNPGPHVHEWADPWTALRDRPVESDARAAKDRACHALSFLTGWGT